MRVSEERSAVAQELVTRHQQFTAKFVIPSMGGVSLVFFAAYFRMDGTAFMAVAAGVVGALINGFVTTHPFLSIGTRVMHLRSEKADALRWVFNLGVLNPAQFLLLGIDPAAAGVGWTILLVAASSELYQNPYNRIVKTLGIGVSILTLWKLGTHDYRTLFLAIGAMSAVVFVVDRLSGFWLQTMSELKDTAIREAVAQHKLTAVMRDAQWGAQSRLVAHELNNLICILEHSVTSNSENATSRRERCIALIRRINALVLNDVNSSKKIAIRVMPDILEDVRVLLKPDIVRRDVAFVLEVDPSVETCRIKENFGSIFLILRNLTVNAAESKDLNRENTVRLKVYLEGNGFVRIDVSDQGRGMNDFQLRRILSGEGISTKKEGHGLGMRFVKDQCDMNGFQLRAASTSGSGSCFSILLPIAEPGEPLTSTEGVMDLPTRFSKPAVV